MKLKVIVKVEEQAGYEAQVPSLPGCTSHGKTVNEALSNLRSAATLWLDEAMNDLDVELVQDDIEAFEQALAIKIPVEKLKKLAKTHPPASSWYAEDFKSP